MKRTSLLFLVLLATFATQAQNDEIRPPRPKVGVVLAGGGAKGASHIGVLKYMEELGIPVDYVAGTSMGSIIGGLYAMGYSPEEMTQLISDMNWSEYIGNKIDRVYLSKEMRDRRSTTWVNIPFGDGSFLKHESNGNLISQLPSAYVHNSSLTNLFSDLCVGYQEEMDFNDMPIPFACVATDLITGKEVVLREGCIPVAMRASMAIPGVFAPVPWGDYLLVDGGLVNNFPADVLREMGADIVIGIDLTNEKKVAADDLKSLPQVMSRILINSTSSKREENRKLCTICIVPDVTGFGMLSFTPDAIQTLVERGYSKAREYHGQLLSVKRFVEEEAGRPVGKELRAPRARNLMTDSVFIASIDITGVSDRESSWLVHKGGLKVGQTYTKNEIERAMSIYRGTGCFDKITYTVKECGTVFPDGQFSDAYALTADVKPAPPHVMGVGLRYDTEEGAALLINFCLNEKKFGSSKFGVSAKLSYNPKLNMTYTHSFSSLANFHLSADYRNEHFRTIDVQDKFVNLHYRQIKANAYISQFHMLNFSTNVGVSCSHTAYDKSSFKGNATDSYYYKNYTVLSPFARLQYDNLDDPYFAKQGILLELGGHYHFMPHTKEKFFDISYAFQAYITPNDGHFTIIPHVYGLYVGRIASNASPIQYFNLRNSYGGEMAGRHFENQLPFIGLTSVEDLNVNNASILRCDLRYNFYGKHYLTAMYNASVPWGMVGTDGMRFTDMFAFMSHGAGLKYSFNSLLGPISLTAHWFNREGMNRFGAYFSFGYTF